MILARDQTREVSSLSLSLSLRNLFSLAQAPSSIYLSPTPPFLLSLGFLSKTPPPRRPTNRPLCSPYRVLSLRNSLLEAHLCPALILSIIYFQVFRDSLFLEYTPSVARITFSSSALASLPSPPHRHTLPPSPPSSLYFHVVTGMWKLDERSRI
jgi:hypothetical protein